MYFLLISLAIIFSGCDYESCSVPDCTPNECSNRGTCKITEKGISYCLCDCGYKPGDEPFTCVYDYDNEARKPIIYLYPTQQTKVNISFSEPENIILTHSYPTYPEGGWQVFAAEDGTLTDPLTGRIYYALYWEGFLKTSIPVNSGFIVKGEDTIKFLEEKLAILGLNSLEANEFIIYWLPVLESNEYNFIHFATDDWEDAAKISVKPQPDSTIRIMMLYKKVEKGFQAPVQELNQTPDRKGFVLVEWGGSELVDETIERMQ